MIIVWLTKLNNKSVISFYTTDSRYYFFSRSVERTASNYHEFIINVCTSSDILSLAYRNFSILLLLRFSFPIVRPLASITIHVCKSYRLNCDCFACVGHPGDNRRIAIARDIVCNRRDISAFRAIFHLLAWLYEGKRIERTEEWDKLLESLRNCTVGELIRVTRA